MHYIKTNNKINYKIKNMKHPASALLWQYVLSVIYYSALYTLALIKQVEMYRPNNGNAHNKKISIKTHKKHSDSKQHRLKYSKKTGSLYHKMHSEIVFTSCLFRSERTNLLTMSLVDCCVTCAYNIAYACPRREFEWTSMPGFRLLVSHYKNGFTYPESRR